MTARDPRLAAYADLVRKWAPRLDLVSPGDLERFERRHIDDSLRLGPLLSGLPPGPCADVGSGAGLPGIPLAIAEPSRRWRLLEPRRKRAAFLEEAVRALGLDCEVVALSAQEAAARPDLAGAHALATARVLGTPEATLSLLAPLVAPGGVIALWLGAGAELPPETVEWGPGIAIMTVEAVQ